jgi:hypothetical protein
MDEPKVHEPPEVIEAFLDHLLKHVSSYVMTNNEDIQKHGLKLLRWICRASVRGRMPKAMQQRYEGVLRNLRPHVLWLQRSGRTIPPVVALELERIRARKQGRQP